MNWGNRDINMTILLVKLVYTIQYNTEQLKSFVLLVFHADKHWSAKSPLINVWDLWGHAACISVNVPQNEIRSLTPVLLRLFKMAFKDDQDQEIHATSLLLFCYTVIESQTILARFLHEHELFYPHVIGEEERKNHILSNCAWWCFVSYFSFSLSVYLFSLHLHWLPRDLQ